ncbi:MAG: hypothetical protein ABI685_03850 [Ferruginibacter sp.]
MLDEEMDDMIRDAAENHHPAYNDKAWEKMEGKLDKHLPQKTDRRRPVFFLLLFLLLGAGTLFTVNQFSKNKNSVAEKNSSDSKQPEPVLSITEKNAATNDKTPTAENAGSNAVDVTPANAGQDNVAAIPGGIPLQTPDKKYTEKFYSNKDFTSNSKGKTKTRISSPNLFLDTETGADMNAQQQKSISGKTGGKQRVTITGTVATEEGDSKKEVTGLVNAENGEPDAAAKLSIAKVNTVTVKDSVNTEKNKKELAKKTEDKPLPGVDKKKKKNNPLSNFGLTFSVGPDMSFVKLSNTGKTTLTYGAGLSYAFAKRFTARAGFYVSKKVYEAAPDQYHTPGGNYPNLTSVNANCKVFEIPVSLAYSFGQRAKHNWFANVGLSSFIMKKEDYIYNYKTQAGQTYTYYNTVNNKNKHYFSVLNLSGGYQYQFNKRLSLQAEPYLKVPLSGVGLGKIKLSSTGVLFTLTVKPFAKKK